MFILILELLVFRYILVAADLPNLEEMSPRVLKYISNQNGVYRLHDEINAEFKINANGWNSGHDEYSLDKNDGIKRICIVGDSYVEAVQVAFEDTFHQILSKKKVKKTK